MIIKRFVYFKPSHELVSTDEPYEDIKYGGIHGRLFNGSTSTQKHIIVFCHGNKGNLSHRNNKILELCKLGYSVLIFDYSGYGMSQGVPSEQQCYDDASTIIALIKQSRKQEEIVLYGESLGAPVAIFIARRYNIPIVILESSLISIKDIIKDRYKFFSALSFLFPEFNTKLFLNNFKGRVLMMHSTEDETVPFNNTLQVQNMVTKFIPMTGSHNDAVIPWEEVDKFIQNIN